jgi:hypothetical protein
MFYGKFCLVDGLCHSCVAVKRPLCVRKNVEFLFACDVILYQTGFSWLYFYAVVHTCPPVHHILGYKKRMKASLCFFRTGCRYGNY